MTDIEATVRSLRTEPPHGLETRTMIGAGAADHVATVDSPFGPVWVSWSIRGVTGLTPRFACETIDNFLASHHRNAYPADTLPRDLEDRIIDALNEGATRNVPIDLRGLATFQHAVLETCAMIEPGTVRSYGWIAERLENPGSVRAVGTALGRNPIPLIIPCHRVVRSDGTIGNYAFGPEMKRQLLIREGAILT
ncbi:MAG: methylated-DNA--[protein]-cysteine S-methyltransferase [Actinomycetia bacterium]|nr:methylated-DNA--[protein]-cysteine S-methyltransferase [Actinomycetes bacterium]